MEMTNNTKELLAKNELIAKADEWIAGLSLEDKPQDISKAFWLIKDLRDHIASTQAWQPIESAPKDGTEILLHFPKHGIHPAYWHQPGNPIHKGFWMIWRHIYKNPTHWQSLPEKPDVE